MLGTRFHRFRPGAIRRNATQRHDFLITGISGIVAGIVSAQEIPKLNIIEPAAHIYDPTRLQGVPWPSKSIAADGVQV